MFGRDCSRVKHCRIRWHAVVSASILTSFSCSRARRRKRSVVSPTPSFWMDIFVSGQKRGRSACPEKQSHVTTPSDQTSARSPTLTCKCREETREHDNSVSIIFKHVRSFFLHFVFGLPCIVPYLRNMCPGRGRSRALGATNVMQVCRGGQCRSCATTADLVSFVQSALKKQVGLTRLGDASAFVSPACRHSTGR